MREPKTASCRPRDHLVAANKLYPNAWRQADLFRADRGKDVPDWPQWCFLPFGAWYAIVSASLRSDRVDPRHIGDVARLAALGAWRSTQGVYRFDRELFDALVSTPVAGKLPHEVLYHLPEWCVYIETDGMTWSDAPLYGFFAHLEHDANTGRPELRLLLDAELALLPVVLHLGEWSLDESIARATDLANVHASTVGLPAAGSAERKAIRNWIEPLVSLVLYLCSESAEIGTGERKPVTPTPKRTKRGSQLFPADRPTTWDVGVRLGSALRRARQDAEGDGSGTHGSPRAHIRRSHWHSFRSGPTKTPAGEAIPTEKRAISVRWLPPIPVNVDDPGELPATIRPVR